MVGCCWLSCLCMACVLAGPFCWLLGAWGRGCSWPVMTPMFPLVGSLGPGGTPLGEERQTGLQVMVIFVFI